MPGRRDAPRRKGDPAPSGAEAVVGAIDASCVVCRFVADAVERRIFFLMAEAIGESWFIGRMRAGGFCGAHLRRLVAAGHGPRLAGPLEDTLTGWRIRRRDSGGAGLPPVGVACPVCETAAWAEGHALGLLVSGNPQRIAVGLGGAEPLCLPHHDRLIDALPWTERLGAVGRWAERLLEAVWLVDRGEIDRDAADGAEAAAVPSAAGGAALVGSVIDILAGPDPDRFVSAREPSAGDAAPAAAVANGWSEGLITEAGLAAELEAGRCPVCSGVAAAPARLIAWLAASAAGAAGAVSAAGPAGAAGAAGAKGAVEAPATAGSAGRDWRDLGALCGPHLRDLLRETPAAGVAVARLALERRLAMLAALPTVADQPPRRLRDRPWWAWRRARARRPDGGRASIRDGLAAVWRALRRPGDPIAEPLGRARLGADRECVACLAAVTARRRVLALLDASLMSRPGRERFEASDGLCLRHAAAAASGGDARFVSAATLGSIGAVAEGRVAALAFELAEALRKSSWSVRFEPVGPERTAWHRAALLVVGSAARRAAGGSTPELVRPGEIGAADPIRPRRAV